MVTAGGRARKGSPQDAGDQTATVPQSSPSPVSAGGIHGIDNAFIWQQLNEVQRSLGSISQSISDLKVAIQQGNDRIERIEDKLEAKLGKFEERLEARIVKAEESLTEQIGKSDDKLNGKIGKIDTDVQDFKQIKHTAKVVAWIVGACAAIVLTVVGFVAKEVWSVVKPLAFQSMEISSKQVPIPPPQPTVAAQPAQAEVLKKP